MRTNIKLFTIVFSVLVFAACSSGGQKTEASGAKEIENTSYDKSFMADLDKSVINWQGWKPTGNHVGTIKISSGKLTMQNEALAGGEFVIDMNSIVDLDLTDADMNAKLVGHLKSADFFETEKYPTATFVITGVAPIDGTTIDKEKEKGDIIPTHAITGNLTMKDVTKSITFNAKIDVSENMIQASTNQFYIDRVDWNVQYGSKKIFAELKDNFINDEMGLVINLVANLQQ